VKLLFVQETQDGQIEHQEDRPESPRARPGFGGPGGVRGPICSRCISATIYQFDISNQYIGPIPRQRQRQRARSVHPGPDRAGSIYTRPRRLDLQQCLVAHEGLPWLA
jgi:hypothetical protein